MQKKLTISVGIPALNEEANIKKLLESILDQKEDNYTLKEIIVISDGSTDNTVKNAKTLSDSKIKIISYRTRNGKACRLNEIFLISNNDLLLLVDADCALDKNAIKTLVTCYINTRSDLIAGNPKPREIKTFMQKTLLPSLIVMDNIKLKFDRGNNVYGFNGRLLLLSKKIYKSIKIPNMSGDDAYIYFYAKDRGYDTFYEEAAMVYYYLPKTLQDHLKQSKRFVETQYLMERYFGKNIRSEYLIPKKIIVIEIFRVFIKYPIYLFIYLCVQTFIRFAGRDKSYSNSVWEISSTTKKNEKKC
ncbi:hypothetical protein COV24_01035 [candidate division WWE3 bacterium CG10_big_fil_rev_8_21_14_0_10_32_10]|uniref:Glycosyltransferase 2-like domain-containing protein n=1 Tax=candidate division WWE3 bacterium CG10_big_fil_rev_8_21_14_0_10_32_10 TaxID=1975090 RepID=A0A2H0RBA3_UNCKA|nr:MAG: hypothetical protein COV24_01035 [candidate division WWE3 bacterium CG10_big_fil_rev_8_21_14_0_10_32_10]